MNTPANGVTERGPLIPGQGKCPESPTPPATSPVPPAPPVASPTVSVSAVQRAPAPPAPPLQRQAGVSTTPAPANRFLVMVEKGSVRVRGLPLGRLSATEARALAAWLCKAADEVAGDGDQEFADLFAALRKSDLEAAAVVAAKDS